MEQARDLQKEVQPRGQRQQPQTGREIRRQPQLIDEELLKEIGGGLREDPPPGPRGTW